jgi:hypothetical protein
MHDRENFPWKLIYSRYADAPYFCNQRFLRYRTREDLRHHDRMLTKFLKLVNFDF